MHNIGDVILVSAYLYGEALRTPKGQNVQQDQEHATVEQLRLGFEHFGVRIDCVGWLGRIPTHSERVAISRELARLERTGCVIRLRSGRRKRTRRFCLTSLGKATAEVILTTPEGQPVLLPISWEDCDGWLAEQGPDADSTPDEARGDGVGGDEGRE